MQRSSGYNKANDKVTEMVSLSQVTLLAVKEGYTENFIVRDGAMVTGSGKSYLPHQVNVVNFYRFEGDSDPADNMTLYVIETDDDSKGTLVNAMGAYADENTSQFMQKVDEIHKKLTK